jgi:hypothetical protein
VKLGSVEIGEKRNERNEKTEKTDPTDQEKGAKRRRKPRWNYKKKVNDVDVNPEIGEKRRGVWPNNWNDLVEISADFPDTGDIASEIGDDDENTRKPLEFGGNCVAPE